MVTATPAAFAAPAGVATTGFCAKRRARSSTSRLLFRQKPSHSFGRARSHVPKFSEMDNFAKYDIQAKEDDERQYGVWGADGIRQRSASFAAMEEDWEDSVFEVWQQNGAGEVMTQRLLILGAKWQKTSYGELYRDPTAVQYAILALKELIPGCEAAHILHQQPSILFDVCTDKHSVANRVVALRSGLDQVPGLKVSRAVGKHPELLTAFKGDIEALKKTVTQNVDVVIDQVGWLLDENGVALVLETCPQILTTVGSKTVEDAFVEYKTTSYEKLNGVKGWSAKLLKCFSDEGQGQNIEAEANTRWCTCFHSLGEDAQFTANRLSVDFAAQVVEPHLRRAKVEEQKNNISR